MYLPPSSSHPQHVFKAIPFGVASRLRRNCSTEDFFTKRLEYKGYLTSQGYPVSSVDKQFSKAAEIPRNTLLSPKARNSKKIFPLVLTYNPNLPHVNKILKKHFHFLESFPQLKELFPSSSIIPSYRRPKKLKEILAPSKYKSNPARVDNQIARGCYKCDKNRCDLCKNFLVSSETFSSFQTMLGKDSLFVRTTKTSNSEIRLNLFYNS